MNGVTIRFYEWLTGKLIVRAAKARHRRGGPDDAHEMRHLLAAITAGNSSPCDGGRACHLDDRELAARFWVHYRCGYVGCPTVEWHDHGGGQTMREMTAEERAAAKATA